MKVSTSGGKPLLSGGRVVTTPGQPCACGDCGGGGGIGACCIDGECSQTTEADCAGVWQGPGSECGDALCSTGGGGGSNNGACCVDTSCHIYTPFGCSVVAGIYQGNGTSCSPNPCGGGTSRCCLPDFSCEDLSAEDCEAAGGTSLDGTCDDAACTCCTILSPFPPGCDDGLGTFRTGPENCDGCAGEVIASDSKWLTLTQYCLDCPGSALTECSTSTWNPITCELTVVGSCDSCTDSTTQSVADQYIPCVP